MAACDILDTTYPDILLFISNKGSEFGGWHPEFCDVDTHTNTVLLSPHVLGTAAIFVERKVHTIWHYYFTMVYFRLFPELSFSGSCFDSHPGGPAL